MAKRMQHCFWCGEALGVYASYHGDIEHCSEPECARQARYAMHFFCKSHRGCTPDSIVTRIEFTRFYGAECGSYPNCEGGCGCGCTKSVERAKARAVLSIG